MFVSEQVKLGPGGMWGEPGTPDLSHSTLGGTMLGDMVVCRACL